MRKIHCIDPSHLPRIVTIRSPPDESKYHRSYPRSAAHNRRHALLISTSYEDSDEWYLPGCVGEGGRVAQALKRALQYDDSETSFLRGSQVTRSGVLGNIQTLMHRSRNLDEIIVYFAGHGVQSPGSGESDGHDEYFVCDDMQRIVDNELAALIRQCSTSCSLIFIFDCCNSGTITDGAAFAEQRSGAPPSGGHHVVLSACRDGEYAFQDHRGRGHLTRALTRRLISRKNVETAWFHSRIVFGAMSQKSIVTVHSECVHQDLFVSP